MYHINSEVLYRNQHIIHVIGLFILCAALGFIVFEGYSAFTEEINSATHFYEAAAASASSALRYQFTTSKIYQDQMANFFLTRKLNVTIAEFKNFTNVDLTLWKFYATLSMQIVLVVTNASRAGIEESVRVAYNDNSFQFNNIDTTGNLIRSPDAPVYYTIVYNEPLALNKFAWGLNSIIYFFSGCLLF